MQSHVSVLDSALAARRSISHKRICNIHNQSLSGSEGNFPAFDSPDVQPAAGADQRSQPDANGGRNGSGCFPDLLTGEELPRPTEDHTFSSYRAATTAPQRSGELSDESDVEEDRQRVTAIAKRRALQLAQRDPIPASESAHSPGELSQQQEQHRQQPPADGGDGVATAAPLPSGARLHRHPLQQASRETQELLQPEPLVCPLKTLLNAELR